MKSLIIGTAGHIDHGKTELVKALTGTDTDRLKEEKERGISIELGFARLDLPGGFLAGIVDVPGHEHFVKNMLAGATGFDMVLMVVAADDGVMPQTVEHLAIVDLLGVKEGVIAVTKADLVEEDMLELVKEDIHDAVRGTCLEGAEIVVTSSRTGRGLEELKHALAKVAEKVPARSPEGPFRLPVDRVFTLRGIGTVVTGTLWEGSVAEGEEAEMMPGGRRLRVRNVQVHGREVERAVAGQRVALNLPGVSKEEVKRGHVIGSPGFLHPTYMLDARLYLLPQAPRPLKNRARVRFHHGTAEVMARVVLLGGREELHPGESALVQFRLEGSVVARYGDRYILRSYSPITTIGGGRILDSRPPKHKYHDLSVLPSLERRERGDVRDLVLLTLQEKGLPLTPGELITRMEMEEGSVKKAVEDLEEKGEVVFLRGGKPYLTTPSLLRSLVDRLCRLTDSLHRADPLKPGVDKETLRQGFDPRMDQEHFEVLLSHCIEEDLLEIVSGRVRKKGGERKLSSREREEKEKIAELIRKGGYSPPLFKELLEVTGGDRDRLRDLLRILLEEGEIEQVNPDYFLSRGKLAEAESLIRSFLERKGRLRVGDLKEMLGATRKYAIPLLEYFDRRRVTRREGDLRVPYD